MFNTSDTLAARALSTTQTTTTTITMQTGLKLKYGTVHRMTYPYVFHGDLKPLRNKNGVCAKCEVLPPDGTKFRKCAACKAVLYCSKECQKAHWSQHR